MVYTTETYFFIVLEAKGPGAGRVGFFGGLSPGLEHAAFFLLLHHGCPLGPHSPGASLLVQISSIIRIPVILDEVAHRVRLFETPQTVVCQTPLCMDSSGKNSGVGCHSLLQEIFWTQGSNLGLPHCRQTLYHLSHQESSHMTSYHLHYLCRGPISK